MRSPALRTTPLITLPWLLLLPLLSGCPDDSGSGPKPPDASDTGDTNDTSDTGDTAAPDGDGLAPDPDASPDTTPDAGDTTGPGRTVAGTSLEGVSIGWAAPMTLCADWSEGAPLADEKARKVWIELPIQARTTLDEDALATGALSGLSVRRSPFGTGSFEPSGAATLTRVTSWQILETGGEGHHLSATVEHTLEGKAGTLFEHYSVSRAPGQPDAVAIHPESFEVTWSYRPFGSDLQPARLIRCGGDPGWEDAVSVVHGTDGKDWATLIRFWRTPVSEGFEAGSYPVVMTGHRLITSDSPWWPTDVRGYWAHTYVAEHHNWNDATEVDLMGDVGHYHTLLRDRVPETTPISKIAVEGLLEFGEGAIVVERASDTGPIVKRYTVADARAFFRVDAAHVARTHAEACTGSAPEVLMAGGADHLVQLLVCGGARPEVVGLMPVAWGSDPDYIGDVFAPTGMNAGGWTFTIGERAVTAFLRPEDYVELLVEDALGELILQSYEKRGPFALPEPWYNPVIAEGTADGTPIRLEIERLWVRGGIGKSQIYAPIHFTVVVGDMSWHIESWDRMSYVNTHHNWEDELTAEADDGTAIHWKTSFFGGTPNILTITAADGTPILEATVIP